MSPFSTPHAPIASLLKMTGELRDIGNTLSLLLWDQETYLPKKAGPARAGQLETLSGIFHDKATQKKLQVLLEKTEEEIQQNPQSFTDHDQALVREMRRDFDLASKIPKALVQAVTKQMSIGLEAWKKAREHSDFSLFAPELSTMVGLKREVAEAIGYSDSPYSALADEYEAGLTKTQIQSIFTAFKPQLVSRIPDLVKRTADFDSQVFHQTFDAQTLWDVSMDVLQTIGFDLDGGRQDKSTHPFTMGIHPTDVRLTTRVIETNPLSTLLSTIHEAGHGMYEQGIAPEIAGTVLGRADSLVIHESQSRFFENHIGKSLEFWEYFFPRFQRAFPTQLGLISPLQAWKEVNVIKPSLIRVDADEVTYHLHIIIRFEIESALIEGALDVAQAPEAWNAKVKEYLGIEVPSDTAGILQDIHWSQGLMGYFPTYSLGSLLSAQLFETLERKMPDVRMRIATGDFTAIRNWLNEHIHQHGKIFSSDEASVRVTGKSLTSDAYLAYIDQKFAS